MKINCIFAMGLSLATVMSACSGSRSERNDENDDKDRVETNVGGSFFDNGTDADSENVAGISDRACYGFKGNVKSVTYKGGRMDGMKFEFDRDGQLVSRSDYSRRKITYNYENDAKYACDLRYPDDNLSFRIDINGNIREDRDLSGNGDFGLFRWTFDDSGRLTEAWSSISFYVISETYAYNGSDPFPSSISISEGEGGAGADMTESYTYKTVDNNGNWTEADVHTVTTVYDAYDDYDGESSGGSEKVTDSTVRRTITYY